MEVSVVQVLEYFEQINAIPRCSKSEGRIARWLQEWAQSRGLNTSVDAVGNMVVRVPAFPGHENRDVVVLQGHMDMVCEKTPESDHDFANDPIRSRRDGDWLTADRTTLGADNGIAVAYALALAEDKTIRRPPLELLFTVDEETGLNGVKAMEPGLISGKVLINLDSEDEGVFTIGCAGGVDTTLDLDLPLAPLPAGWDRCIVRVGGLRGGHSGIDIHKHRGNANKILARTLARIHEISGCRLIAFKGGTRHNAIPRDAQAQIAVKPSDVSLEKTVLQMLQVIRQEYADHDDQLSIQALSDSSAVQEGLSPEGTQRAIQILLALPHGVAGMSPKLPGRVETSSNLAIATLAGGHFHLLSSQRSATASRLAEMTAVIRSVAALAGARVHDDNKYPAWQPDVGSPLLQQARQVYAGLFGKEPIVQVIHAGLECAIIGDRYPGMHMISFGPTIRNPHSPTEKMHIPSIGKVWQLLAGLLEILGRENSKGKSA